MTTNPLPASFILSGHPLADSLKFHLSIGGGGFSTSAGVGISIYWLTPEMLRLSLLKASGRFLTLRVTGSFIGCSYMRSDRDAGEFGHGVREITQIALSVEFLPLGFLFDLDGELGAEQAPLRRGRDALTSTTFQVRMEVPDVSLASAIQGGNAEGQAAELIRLRKRRLENPGIHLSSGA